MDDIIIKNADECESVHKQIHQDYEYYKKKIVSVNSSKQCAVSIYEIPPKKSAYPYHYHLKNEEVFYIISGEGLLKTPNVEKIVKAGDFLFFSANEKGAHKLTNKSLTEKLIYIDFDTINDIDVTIYPNSEKIGVWGKNINKTFLLSDQTDYYEGE